MNTIRRLWCKKRGDIGGCEQYYRRTPHWCQHGWCTYYAGGDLDRSTMMIIYFLTSEFPNHHSIFISLSVSFFTVSGSIGDRWLCCYVFFFIPGFLTGPFPCWFAMLIVEFSPSHLRCTWTVEAAGPWSGWTFVATCVEEWRDDGVPPGRFPPRLSSHGSRADYRWLKWARLLSKREWRGGRVSNRFHFTS